MSWANSTSASVEPSFAGARVLVVGLGLRQGGEGAVRWLIKRGARVTVTDIASTETLSPVIARLQGFGIRWVIGEHRLNDFVAADLIVRNPAVPPDLPELVAARSAGVAITTDIELFLKELPSDHRHIAAVTGTKGKTTVTRLLGAMVRSTDKRVVVAGNLGVSVLDALPHIDRTTPIVLELSSYQLEHLHRRSAWPAVTVVTNIHDEHLDRHKSFAAYVEAKCNLLRQQDRGHATILNAELRSLIGTGLPAARTFYFAVTDPGAPRACFVRGNQLVIREGGVESALAALSDIRLRGRHNVENALAAIAAADCMGCSADDIVTGLRSVAGVPGRLEPLPSIRSIRIINDNAAAHPIATIAALATVTEPSLRVALIIDGANKRHDLAPLIERIIECDARVVGVASPRAVTVARLLEASGHARNVINIAPTLEAALEAAVEWAAPSGVVLFSPSSAADSRFSDTTARGVAFTRAVEQYGAT